MKTKSLERLLKPANVVFNEKQHVYTSQSGELYTGCTTISEAWHKDFLGPWYAKEMFLEASRRIGEIALALKDNPIPNDAIKILEECKGAARRKGDEAKKNGDLAHEYLEKVLGVKISGKGKRAVMPKSEQALNAVNAFIEWVKQNNVQWLASEEIVASHEHKIAGTLDAIAVVDGITYLVDFKTSSQISPSYLIQCAGYDLMLREMGLQVMGYMILRLPKDGKPAETLTITNQTDMQFFRETLLRQREAHKFYVYMESMFKDVTTKKMKVDVVDLPIKQKVAVKK